MRCGVNEGHTFWLVRLRTMEAMVEEREEVGWEMNSDKMGPL
jgi:hypothetical protein